MEGVFLHVNLTAKLRKPFGILMAFMLPLDTYLESVLQVSLIQDLSALPLLLNYWPHGTNAKVN